MQPGSPPKPIQALKLLQNLENHALPPVVLICPGTPPFQRDPSFEPFLAERLAQAIVDRHVDPGMHDLTYSAYYADDAKISEIVMEAETMPFLAERRVVLVRHAERYMAMASDKRAPLAPFLQYLESPAETTLMILIADSVDRRKKFFNACKDAGLLVECPLLTDAELKEWVRKEVSLRYKTITEDAVGELLGRSGNKLGDVNNAITLLASYLGERTRIEQKDVAAACADVAEESVWRLTDAIARSESDKALRSLHQLMDYGKSHDEIIGTINWMIENAYKASPHTQAPRPSNFVVNKVLPLAEKLGLAKLIGAMSLCTRTQFMLRTTGVNRDLALELLVIKLAAGGKKPAPETARRTGG